MILFSIENKKIIEYILIIKIKNYSYPVIINNKKNNYALKYKIIGELHKRNLYNKFNLYNN